MSGRMYVCMYAYHIYIYIYTQAPRPYLPTCLPDGGQSRVSQSRASPKPKRLTWLAPSTVGCHPTLDVVLSLG